MSKPVIEQTSVVPALDSQAQDHQTNTASGNFTDVAPTDVAPNGVVADSVVPDNLAAQDQEVVPGAMNGAASDAAVSQDASAPDGVSQRDAVAEEEDSRDAIQTAHADASLEIDHRRAKQLLDRALLLSERGDLAGAILAARQAVVLTPASPAGHSMLGLLHERAGDLEKAIASYEKAVQLAPHSTLERDSLERLKATLSQENSSVLFHFDDNELFEEPEALPTAPTVPTMSQGTKPATPVAAPPAGSAQPAVAASASVASAVKTAPAATSAPVITSAVVTTAATPSVSVPPAIKPLDFDVQVKRPPLVRALLNQPSFYFKSAPLVATTALGLIFMSWAQGVSQNKQLAELPRVTSPALTLEPGQKAPVVTDDSTTTAPAPASGVNPAPPPPGTAPGGDILGNGTGAQQGRVGTSATGSGSASRPATSAPRTAASGGGSGGSGGATAPLPPSAASPIIPQPAVREENGSGGAPASPFAGLRPITPRSDSAPAVRPGGPTAPAAPAAASDGAPAASSGDGGNSRGGGLFNPGSQPRGVVRVDPVRPSGATAPRPANVVRRSEAAAASAAAQGNTGGVISNMSDSIGRLPTGYAYQRRAMAFLEQRDYSRAADDFQSAIAAFEDQIRRGQDVEDARAGVRTCRSGLQMAVANMRR